MLIVNIVWTSLTRLENIIIYILAVGVGIGQLMKMVQALVSSV